MVFLQATGGHYRSCIPLTRADTVPGGRHKLHGGAVVCCVVEMKLNLLKLKMRFTNEMSLA